MNYYKKINFGREKENYIEYIKLVLSRMLENKLYYTYEIKWKPTEYKKNSLIKSDILVLKDILTEESINELEKNFYENFIENIENYDDSDDDDSEYNKFDVDNVYIKIISRSDKWIEKWENLESIDDIINTEKKKIKKWSNMWKSKKEIIKNVEKDIWLVDNNNNLINCKEKVNWDNIEYYITK